MRSLLKSVDVFIVGGGPAGLAAAIAARRRGFTVAVADGAIAPIDKACGEGLMPDGIEALRQLGVVIPRAEVRAFRGIRFLSADRRAQAEFSHGPAYGVRRTTLHRVLVDHAAAAGATLLWQTPVEGLHADGVVIAGRTIRARWIIGADGPNSLVRRWAGLDGGAKKAVRYGFRRHYLVAPWTDFMELHWGRVPQIKRGSWRRESLRGSAADGGSIDDCRGIDDNRVGDSRVDDCGINDDRLSEDCQIYVTPVSHDEVCLALVSSNPHVRIERALGGFPELGSRFMHAAHASSERGSITVSRKLRRVYRDRVALVGDASGGVDAITGEGLCLAFRQAALLADCLATGDVVRYQREHARLMRRPALMARLMLLLARHERLRQRTMQVFESQPKTFAAMLAMHTGAGSPSDYLSNGLWLGWQLLRA